MKAGLHSLMYAGLFYEGSSLTLEQIIERAADYGYGDGAAFFRSRYAAEFPQARCAALRASSTGSHPARQAAAGQRPQLLGNEHGPNTRRGQGTWRPDGSSVENRLRPGIDSRA